MSVRVPLEEVAAAATERGDSCFLLTTNADSTPHPAHVPVAVDGDQLIVSAGRRSLNNALDRGPVTLLWPTADPDAMHLIVDGEAHAEPGADRDSGGPLRIIPTSGMWHRQPGQPPA